MKCIKNGTEVRRVSNTESMNFVNKGWTYCPKNEWKKTRKRASTESPIATSDVSVDIGKKHKDNSRGKDYKRKKAEKRADKSN